MKAFLVSSRGPLSFLSLAALVAAVGVASPLFAGCGDDEATPTDGGADAGNDTSTPPPGDGGDDGGPTATGYVYSTQPSAANAEAALDLFNAQGAEGSAYVGPYLGAGLPTSALELFVKPSPAITLTYAREAAARESTEAFAARLDAQGAKGFAFKGPISFAGAGTEIVYVKSSARAATYTYSVVPAADDEKATAAALENAGAKGFSYVTDYVTDDTQPTTTRVHVFQKVGGSTATYKYELPVSSDDRSTIQADLDARGKAGAVWRGGVVLAGSSRFVFEIATPATPAVSYRIVDQTGTDGPALLGQLNPLGAEGYYFVGPYVFGGKSTLVLVKGATTALPITGTVLP